MANTLITPTVLLREAGRLFHQKARFLSTIDRQYDDRFAKRGAKAGDTIALRDPVEFTVGSSRVISVQDVTETSQNLTVGTRRNVAFKFNAEELSLDIDDFSKRYLEKAVARLAAEVESVVLTGCWKRVANLVDSDGSAFSFRDTAKAKRKLDEFLAPSEDRYLALSPAHAEAYLDAVKAIQNPAGKISNQYSTGMVQDVNGFNVYSTTLLTNHTTGTAAEGDTSYDTNDATDQTGSTLTVDTGSTTFEEGDVIEIEGVNAVHPETKADLGYRKQFVVTADAGANATSLSISPAIVASGAKQNVTNGAANNKIIYKIGAGNAETLVQSLAYHKEAFVFATADLEDPSKYGQWGATEVMDGLSMRVWRSADIINDEFPCRIDVFFGYLPRYPQLASRIHADG